MKSRAGFILLLIDAVIAFIGAFFFLLGTIILFVSPSFLDININGSISYLPAIGALLLLILLVIIGLLRLYSAKLMNNSRTTTTGGIVAIVLGVVSFSILSLIGGILGVVAGGKK